MVLTEPVRSLPSSSLTDFEQEKVDKTIREAQAEAEKVLKEREMDGKVLDALGSPLISVRRRPTVPVAKPVSALHADAPTVPTAKIVGPESAADSNGRILVISDSAHTTCVFFLESCSSGANGLSAGRHFCFTYTTTTWTSLHCARRRCHGSAFRPRMPIRVAPLSRCTDLQTRYGAIPPSRRVARRGLIIARMLID